MPIRLNEFEDRLPSTSASRWRARLRAGESMFGMWLACGSPYVAEICGDAGADWLLVDAEHSPNDLRSILGQLQALSGAGGFPVVRAPAKDPLLLGRLLDIGARGLMVPMVESVEQAEAVVRATRYPPAGTRGAGTAFARAARWNGISDYFANAEDSFSLIVQIESLPGVDALPKILEVDGIDGVFVGPADLAASMGHLGKPGHPEVRAVVEAAIGVVAASDKFAGVNAFAYDDARHYERLGARMLLVGADTTLLATGSKELMARYKEGGR